MVDRPIPLFLELCTSVIESRLQKTDKSVYVSSAKGVRLQELCTQYGFDKFYEGNGKPINQPTVSLEAIGMFLNEKTDNSQSNLISQ